MTENGRKKNPGWLHTGLIIVVVAILFFGLSACQQTREPVTFKLPTELVTALPSKTESATLSATSSALPPTKTATIQPTVTETPIPSETPTVTLTLNETEKIEASYTVTPSLTYSLTPTITKTLYRWKTRTPTQTSTPTATLTPTPAYAQMRIQKPGPYSKVTSPFQIEAMIHPGDDGLVRIQLIGEDGRIVSSQLLNYYNYINRRFWIAPQIEFEISGVAETARLELIAQDQFSRPMDIFTLDLLLLQMGKTEFTPIELEREPYIIRYPSSDDVVHGGAVWISGLIRPLNSSPITIELLDENNDIIGQSVFQVAPPSGDLSHTPFAIEVPYEVEEYTSVRVVIFQESDGRIPGIAHLSSFLLTIAP
ncbi:MAG: hypothetical protein JEZ00_18815 [Anaerolineaceae bacterium]|nr:hypothetical protein [Anaerolineaceae bacterium]